MTATKTVMSMSALAFAALFGGGLYFIMHINTFAKPIVEKIATNALGVTVLIDNMDVKLAEKSVHVGGISIANPEGFGGGEAITVKDIDVALESLAEDKITFANIAVNGTVVNLKVKPGGTNLSAIQKNTAKNQAPVKTGENQKPMKVIINKLGISPSTLNPTITLVTEEALEPVNVPAVNMSGIGKRENGIVAGEAVEQVINALLEKSSDAAGSAGYYEGLSADALKDMGVSQVEQLKNQINDEVDKIGENLKNIFN